jgi:hypothetical protein
MSRRSPIEAISGCGLGDFLRWQDAALAGFRPLAQLDLEHPHLRVVGHHAQFFVRQPPPAVAHPVFRRADLEDDVAPAFQVPVSQPAFTGVHPHPGQRCATAQRLHCRARQRPEAHARDVEKRRRVIGFARIGSDPHRQRFCRVAVEHREHVVGEQRRPRDRQVPGRAECHRVAAPLAGAVDPFALGAVERHLLTVHGEEILAEELAKLGEQHPESPQHRIVAPDRVAGLQDIDDEEDDDDQRRHPDGDDKQRGEILQPRRDHVPERHFPALSFSSGGQDSAIARLSNKRCGQVAPL